MLEKLKQFKDLRSQAKQMQDMLSKESVSTQTAGGNVVMTIDGNMRMTGLAIDPSMLTASNQQKLQDAIKEAHEESMKKIQRVMATKMKEIGGFNLPGLTS